jgi:hypothetical protein
MVTEREVTYFGMRYVVPVMVDSPGVILAPLDLSVVEESTLGA